MDSDLSYLVRGFKMLREPGIRPFVILPIAVNVLIFGERFASQVKQAFIQDIKAAKQLQVSSWERRSQLKKFLEKMARLIAPIL